MRNHPTFLKKLAPILIFSFLAVFAFASDSHKKGVTEFNNDLTIVERIESDLLNGVWINKAFDSNLQLQMYFNPNGLAHFFFLREDATEKYAQMTWKVGMKGIFPVLFLTNTTSGERNIYKIKQTDDGFSMIDVLNGEKLNLSFAKSVSEKQNNSFHQFLIGSWENTLHPIDIVTYVPKKDAFKKIENASLNYHFNADGTYEKNFISKKINGIEKGIWQMSRDGAFLILQAQSSKNTKVFCTTEIIKVNHLHFDELVLEQKFSLLGDESTGQGSPKALYFYKI